MSTSFLPINWTAVYGQQNTAAQMLSDIPFQTFESLETAPLSERVAQLEQQVQQYTNQDSAWSTLQQDATGFTAAWQALGASTAWTALQATSSDTSVIQAAADSSAVAGTYAVSVGQLALQEIDGVAPSTALTSTSVPLASLSSTWAAASLSISLGGATYTVAVTASTTLANVADALNALGASVSATVDNAGTSASPSYYLQLIATTPDTPISYGGSASAAGDWTDLGLLTSTGSVAVVQAAQPAEVSLGSASVTSTSNTITNLIPGVTLTLDGTGSSTITVSPNTGAMVQQIQNAVAAWNQWVQDTFTLAFGTLPGGGTTETANPKQVLHSALPMMAINDVATTFSTLTAGSSSLSLGDVGVTFATTGGMPTLTVDTTTLQNALANNPSGVSSLFAALAQQVTAWSGGFGQGSTSTAGTALSGDQQAEQQLQSQITQEDAAIAQMQKAAQSQYQQWADQLNQLASEQNMVGAMLSSLTNSGSSSSGG